MLSVLLQQVLGEWSELLIRKNVSLKPPLSAIQISGGRTKDRKINFLVFSHHDSLPSLILKVGRTSGYQEQLRREFQAANTVWELLPALRKCLPQPVGLMPMAENLVMIERCLPGTALANLLNRRQHTTKTLVRKDFSRVFEWLQAMQSATHAGEEQFPGRAALEERLQRYKAITEIALPESFTHQLLDMADSFEGTRMPRVGCHGDFWPGNILVAGGAFGVIDWEDFRQSPHPLYDFFQFTILHARIYPWRGWREISQADSFRHAVLENNWYSNIVVEFIQKSMQKLEIPTPYAHLLFSLYLLDQAAPTIRQGIKRQQQAGLWQQRLGWYASHYQGSIFLQ